MTDTRPLTSAGAILGDRYRLGGVLGTGGMATVSRARDERLGRDVAVKLFRPDVADAHDLRRISSEIRMLASLNHRSLVTLHDASTGQATEAAYLVLELVDGPNLAELLASRAVSAAELARLLAQVADALSYIAARGIVHRDVKPENILVTRDADGELLAKLADLGIARIADESRLTTAGAVLGTARYLSPEQVAGTWVGPPSDVYSLGIVLLESLTGAVAFPGSGTEAAVARMLRSPLLPGGLAGPDAALLARMTDVDPAGRPSPRDVRQGLLHWSSPGPFPLPAGAASLPTGPTRMVAPVDATEVLPAAAAAEAAPTRVIPAADSTEALPAAVRPAPAGAAPTIAFPRPAPGPPRRSAAAPDRHVSRRRRGAWSVLLVVLLAGGSAGVVAAWPAISDWVQPGPSQPPPSYPAVVGQLGADLTKLEAQVEGGQITGDVTLKLRDHVLAVATAAAVTDYPSAVTSLETMKVEVDAAALADHLTSARYGLLLTAIQSVRADLDASIAAKQAELQRVQAEQARIQQQNQSPQSGGLFDGLRARLDQLGQDLQGQIDRWAAQSGR